LTADAHVDRAELHGELWTKRAWSLRIQTLISPQPRSQREDTGNKSMATEITLEEHFAGLARYFRAKANNEKGKLKAEWEHLANCYTEIANKFDKKQLSEPAR
jgi:hypothetical protein